MEPPESSSSAQSDGVGKRLFDLAVASILLVPLSPLLLLVAIAVRISSRGPVLFKQKRVGRDGRTFMVYKFRTMRHLTAGASVTLANDDRITFAGKYLRFLKFDELPQLVNVLKGEMSLVGPRPEVPEYVQGYSEDQRRVLALRPGMTGPAQIAFRHEGQMLSARADPEEYYRTVILPEKLRIDLSYLEKHSILGDIGILLKTLAILFVRDTGTLPIGNEQ